MEAGRADWFDVLAYPVRLDILRSLTERDLATAPELAGHTNASDPAVRQHLEELVGLGVVRKHCGEGDGLTPGRPAARFSLDPEVRESTLALLEILSRPIGSWPRRTPWPPPAR